MKQIFVTGTLLAALCGLASAPARAQAPGSGGPTPTTPVSPDPTPVPIDGGASLLLASGVAYGLKRLRTQRRRA
ncbi:MAG: PID-CTERM protein-sorting domain-containing protein [Janthinobacterium lividum]